MSKNDKLYVDIHVIQTVPPSCVNRDDTGSPKQCIYGGVRRSRVSSQSWKRAVRMAFRDMYAPKDCGCRTKNVVGMVAEQISAIDKAVDAPIMAEKVLETAGLKIKTKDSKKETESPFFISKIQAKALAEIAVASAGEKLDKAACQDAIKNNPSVDIVLFGRMVAGETSLNYDASVMVAHAISTHKVQNEFDYFTAVDDLSSEESSGANYLGTVEFNSSTLYRYASVNVRELAQSLGDDAALAVRNFVEAFLLSMPTGKITTFANRTLPNAVYVTVRNDQPVNMAAAFEKPVRPDEDGGYITGSEKALIRYAESVYTSFVDDPDKEWTIGENMEALGNTVNLKTMLEEMQAFISDKLAEE